MQALLRWFYAVILLAAATASVAQTESRADYVLGPGDVVHITVYQSPDLTLDTRLSENGFITFPLIGQIKLGGLSVMQAEKALADALVKGKFLKSPQVTLTVSQVRGNQASVLGQVARPGRYPLEGAELRLSDLLAQAGGVTSAGSDIVTVTGTRDGKPMRIEVDIPSLFTSGQNAKNPVIVNNDVIFVDRMPTVYIYGEVQRPGVLRLERDMNLMQALASGGGLTQRGTTRGLEVHRRSPDGKTQILKLGMQDLLRDGDVIQVKESLF